MTSNKFRFGICIVAGAGGIGSNLIEPLTRLLMFHPQGTWRILVIDGDSYELKNRVRQLFDPKASNLNKAIATTQRLKFAPNLIAIDKYLNPSTLYDLLSGLAFYLNPEEPLLFVSCVDNHQSRKAFLEALDTHVPSYVFVNPSNGYETVQVSLHIKYKGDEMTVHPFKRYEDIAHPSDRIPGGCQEEAPSTPQLLVANALAANGALMLVNALLDGKPVYDELVGDVYKMQLKPQGRPIKL
jgi:hypothetical protein